MPRKTIVVGAGIVVVLLVAASLLPHQQALPCEVL